jgi:hypothetical protein
MFQSKSRGEGEALFGRRPVPATTAPAPASAALRADAAERDRGRVGVRALECDDGWVHVDDFGYPPAPPTPRIVPTGEAGEQLAAQEPGAELAYLLEQVELGDAEDYDVVEVVAAWQRMAGWVAAGAARVAAVLAERPSMNPIWPATAGNVAEPNVAGDELAIRLGCSRRQGRLLVRDGRAYAGALAWTGDALARGEIDPTKARILVNGLVDLPVPLALGVQEAVLDGAACRTPSQLTKDVTRTMLALDPAGCRAHRDVAEQGRRVDRPRVLPHGMAGVWAVLPAVGATRLDNALDSLARGARAAGDPRTLDQLRADLLVDLTTGEVPGGPTEAALCGRSGSGVARDSAGTANGIGPASGATEPAPTTPAAATLRGDGTPSTTDPDDACGPAFRGTARRTEIRVTVPLSTLLGVDDGPAELAGYGPIDATAARALARGGTWRRLVTDPLDGRVLNVGRTRYRPPAEIADHVRARDGTCARPGCSADAASCDLDHTIEFHRHGGETSDANLEPLCGRDHTVKTDGGFKLAQVSPGLFEWETPTGHRYRLRPGLNVPYERQPRLTDGMVPF